jgi:hypothetical protein
MLYKQELGVMVYSTAYYISVRGAIQTDLGVMVFNTVYYISVRGVIQTRARGYGI